MSAATIKPSIRPREPRLWGLLAEYETPGELLHAAEQVRDAGFKKWDCLTPFPVHGLDTAMGIRRTVLPWVILAVGLTGLAFAIFMQWYVNSPYTQSASLYVLSGYPLTISGKPYWSVPPNVPVMFEFTVLTSSLTAFYGLWMFLRLPRYHHPLFSVARFRRATDDRFFLVVEATDEKFDAANSRALLEGTHPAAIEEVKD
ncbi:MAG TPA: DUF3341 domain-containing protein [Candidatus Saccharimonadales bacterium]|nr:DUF3341 domain-containing protein [Candidatus Saccharimonadales bacterium]